MKKRLCTLVLALLILSSLVMGALPAMASYREITLRVHYHRADGNYDGWNLWLWDNSNTTPLDPPYQFVKEGNDMVATATIYPGTLEVGYIVRRSVGTKEWAEKDIDEDQFIEIAGIMSGTVDVYVKSGIKGHEIVLGKDVVKDTVIVNASYRAENSDGDPRIVVKMSNKVEDYEVTNETFNVFNKDYSSKIIAVKNVNNYYYLTLSEKLDLMRGYWVTFEDEEAALRLPDVYSTEEFEERFTYKGDDLGATYTADKTSLRLWAPLALGATVNLYKDGDPKKDPEPFSQVIMTKDVQGTWVCDLIGDMANTYYTYKVEYDTREVEACDPYARSTGINGHRAMIFDLNATNPKGWNKDKNPNASMNYTDSVIYEGHIRDLTCDPSSGIKNKGKFLGLTETGTHTKDGIPTGLDHILDLGVTHLHLLPVYDFGSIDESKPEEERGYNWGYDPFNYNVPEGSYCTDPTDGTVRVKEFKQMVKKLHDEGISVVMDVVYNHVYDAGKFSFNQLVPDYYVRPGSNASYCGNDVASERSMVSKYIVDSVNYWVDEYHIDGFRFDLMGILDTETMNEIARTVHEKRPDVLFYGEGWVMNTKLTKSDYTLATQYNSALIPEIASFNDAMRNTLKGHDGFGTVSPGFISGGNTSIDELNACFKGMPSWCPTPSQCINYASCHDNHTLFDHITLVNPDASEEEKAAINKLCVAVYMTAQGIPFFQAGEEMMRSKPNGDDYDDDSYTSPDSVNALKWDTLSNALYMDMYEYYKGMIEFRKAHPALRLTDAESVEAAVQPMTDLPMNVAAYRIQGGQKGEQADAIFCAFNAGTSAVTVNLPDGEWHIRVNAEDAGTKSLGKISGTVELPARSAMVLTQGEPVVSLWMIILIGLSVLVVATVVTTIIIKKKKMS